MDHEVVKNGAGGGGGGASEDPQGYVARFRRSAAGFDAVTAAEPPTLLALAMQVWWPEDPAKPEGKLVQTLQDEESPLSARLKALKVGTDTPAFQDREREAATRVDIRRYRPRDIAKGGVGGEEE